MTSEASPPGSTDEALLERARQGDQRAFTQLVRLHEGRVAATTMGMLGNAADAEDVAQEVFLRFHRSLHRFEGRSSVASYLTRIAINQSLERLKKRRRWLGIFTETEWERDERADPRPPEQHAGEGDEWVHEQLLRLDPPHRAVVVMRIVNDCTVDETARALGIPPGTVMSRLSRALDKLRAGLAPGDKEKDK